jgi:hypothetical protein
MFAESRNGREASGKHTSQAQGLAKLNTLQIIGSLGCSKEVLHCIADIDILRQASRKGNESIARSKELRVRPRDLEENIHSKTDEAPDTLDNTHIALTVEFSGKAAPIYREQVAHKLTASYDFKN